MKEIVDLTVDTLVALLSVLIVYTITMGQEWLVKLFWDSYDFPTFYLFIVNYLSTLVYSLVRSRK